MTKRLILDFDETIVNTKKAFIEVHQELFGKEPENKLITPKWELVQKYDFSDQIPTLNSERLYQVFDSELLYSYLEYYDNAKEIIEELSSKTEVVIASMCSIFSVERKGVKILKDLPLVKFQPILYPFYGDKASIDMRNGIFIDDHIKNLSNNSADKNICFRYNGCIMDTNKDWNGEILTKWDNETYKYLIKELGL